MGIICKCYLGRQRQNSMRRVEMSRNVKWKSRDLLTDCRQFVTMKLTSTFEDDWWCLVADTQTTIWTTTMNQTVNTLQRNNNNNKVRRNTLNATYTHSTCNVRSTNISKLTKPNENSLFTAAQQIFQTHTLVGTCYYDPIHMWRL